MKDILVTLFCLLQQRWKEGASGLMTYRSRGMKQASASRRLKDIKNRFSVCFSSDGNKIASGSRDNTVRMWNIETGECIKTLKDILNVVLFASAAMGRRLRLVL